MATPSLFQKKSNFHNKKWVTVQVRTHMKNTGPQNDNSTGDKEGQTWTWVKGNVAFD